MFGCLLRRQFTTVDQQLGDRVVLGKLIEPPAAQQIGAAVPHVCHYGLPAADERQHHRRAHPLQTQCFLALFPESLTQLDDGCRDLLGDLRIDGSLHRWKPILEQPRQDLGHNLRGQPAGCTPADPVGHQEEPLAGIGEPPVFVNRAMATYIAQARVTDRAHYITCVNACLSSAADLNPISGSSTKAWSITSARRGGIAGLRRRMGTALVSRMTCQGSQPLAKLRG